MREVWDDKFSGKDYFFGTIPNAFLVDQSRRFSPGMSALCVADGEGRNGVWLAEQGLDVVSVDFSKAGLAKARELARSRGVSVETICADLLSWKWPQGAFDVVVALYIHFPEGERSVVNRAMLAALKPGGVLVMEVFHPDQLRLGFESGGPQDPELLYTADGLRHDFADAEIITLEELVLTRSESRHAGKKAAITRLIAKRQ